MIRDITIGQYYPAQSPIHKLDPRVKLFATKKAGGQKRSGGFTYEKNFSGVIGSVHGT